MTFPVGDWFLGVGDGGIGRDKAPLKFKGYMYITAKSFFGKSWQDNPAEGALIMKGGWVELGNLLQTRCATG